MDILAALKTEESKLQQQMDTVHAAKKLVKENKVSPKKRKAMTTAK